MRSEYPVEAAALAPSIFPAVGRTRPAKHAGIYGKVPKYSSKGYVVFLYQESQLWLWGRCLVVNRAAMVKTPHKGIMWRLHGILVHCRPPMSPNCLVPLSWFDYAAYKIGLERVGCQVKGGHLGSTNQRLSIKRFDERSPAVRMPCSRRAPCGQQDPRSRGRQPCRGCGT